MSETVVDDMVALLPPLFGTLDALTFVSRYLNPYEFAAVLQAFMNCEDRVSNPFRFLLRNLRAQLGIILHLHQYGSSHFACCIGSFLLLRPQKWI